MLLRTFSLSLVGLSVVACAETTTQTAQQDNAAATATMRNRPRRSAARRALRDAAMQARECLPLTVERADVSGSFAGRTGRYSVESVLGENIGREQRDCIRAAFEGARVLPFRAERYELAEVVSRSAAATTTGGEGGGEPASSGGEGTASSSAGTGGATANSSSGTTAATATTATNSSGAASTGATANGSSGATAATATTATNSSGAAVSTATTGSGSAAQTGTSGSATAVTATAQTGSATAAAAGTIEQTAVANIMRTRTAVVRTCYQNQLTREPLLRARVRVRFTIDAAGLVTSASSTAVAEAGDPDRVSDLARCVEGIIRGTTFPARAGASPAEVSMPFVFSPGAPSTTVATASSATAATNSTGAIATPGTLDRDRVAVTIRARMPQLSQCYARASQQDPQLAGRITVRFVVNPDGRVADVQSQPTTLAGNPTHMMDVARCVQSAFFGFVFSPPTGGAAAAVLPLDFGASS